ncbi:testis-expressed protein 30 isoform 1-T1 [Synchiropus picturatus]
MEFSEEEVKVPFGPKHLDASLCVPAAAKHPHTSVILTHGAGGDMNFKQLVSLAHCLASNGFVCLRFTCKGLNLTYRVRAYRAVLLYLRSLQRLTIDNIIIGGRSMGSRAAAALARQLSDEPDNPVQGVLCLSFPLHPPRQTHVHRQRSEDLKRLPETLSVLFVSGTDDDMCDKLLLEGTLKEMKAESKIFWLDGGSHGLTVKGRMDESVMDEVNSHVISWMSRWKE